MSCGETLRRVWKSTAAGFASLQGSPPDLWKVYALKVCKLPASIMHGCFCRSTKAVPASNHGINYYLRNTIARLIRAGAKGSALGPCLVCIQFSLCNALIEQFTESKREKEFQDSSLSLVRYHILRNVNSILSQSASMHSRCPEWGDYRRV